MLGNSRGRDYDVFEGGDRVLSVRYLNAEEPVMCCICERPTFSKLSVPYYCGAVLEGASEGGYATACERCYPRWEAWNDAELEYRSWRTTLGVTPISKTSDKTRNEGGA